jgi:hypothetical protein
MNHVVNGVVVARPCHEREFPLETTCEIYIERLLLLLLLPSSFSPPLLEGVCWGQPPQEGEHLAFIHPVPKDFASVEMNNRNMEAVAV